MYRRTFLSHGSETRSLARPCERLCPSVREGVTAHKQQQQTTKRYDRDALDRATRQDPSRLRSSRFKDEQMERNRSVPKALYDDR